MALMRIIAALANEALVTQGRVPASLLLTAALLGGPMQTEPPGT